MISLTGMGSCTNEVGSKFPVSPKFHCTNLHSYRPANSHEYFNLCHAQLHNVVERIIGVLKRRFWILVIPPEFNMDIQAKIPPALCCIHNIIRQHDPEELRDTESQLPTAEYPGGQTDQTVVFGTLAGGFITAIERDRMTAKQDDIAGQLWEDHLSYIQRS